MSISGSIAAERVPGANANDCSYVPGSTAPARNVSVGIQGESASFSLKIWYRTPNEMSINPDVFSVAPVVLKDLQPALVYPIFKSAAHFSLIPYCNAT